VREREREREREINYIYTRARVPFEKKEPGKGERKSGRPGSYDLRTREKVAGKKTAITASPTHTHVCTRYTSSRVVVSLHFSRPSPIPSGVVCSRTSAARDT